MSGGRGCGESLRCRDPRRGSVQGNQPALDAQEKFPVQSDQLEAERGEMQRPGVDRDGDGEAEPDWQDRITACPVFYPSREEFEDPMSYIRSIAPEASIYGICKIVSPVVASVSAGTVLSKERSNFKFTTRVQPMRLANWDSKDHITFLISGRAYTFHDFEKMANKVAFRKYQTTGNLPPKFIESEFWREMASGKTQSVEYACDIEGSAFSSCKTDPLGSSRWNLKVLPYSPQSILRLLQNAIPGVTDPMLYIGMLFSMFAWHVEDHYLYSINYLHCGAPKTWYGVPGRAAPDFERVARDNVYDPAMLAEKGDGAAYDLLIGKTTLFSPKLLCDNHIPVYRAVQGPGEFVITFPRAYHAGFSHGFNCGEAVNFAMLDWLPFGAAACRRYVLLNRLPLLPHEELLCREAMHYSKEKAASGSLDISNGVSLAGGEHRKCLKVSFVRLMRFQHKIRWFLKQRTARSVISPEFEGSEQCSLCKHMCYVAYINCSCVQLPFCLNHAKEIRECNCGNRRLVNIKSNLGEMEQAARQFEKEDGILEELCREPAITDVTNINGAVLEENMFDSDDYKSYVWDADLKEDLSSMPHNLFAEVQGADAGKGPVKRYSSVSVIVNKSSNNLQSFCRATRALGSLSCVPHFGTPVQAVPVEVLPPDEPDNVHLALNENIIADNPPQQGSKRDTDERSVKSCTCTLELAAECYCCSQKREIGLSSVKRKRSGLIVRQMRTWGDEHAKRMEAFQEPRSIPCASVVALPNDDDDEDDDGPHTVKRQRMASLDKIRSDGDPGSMSMKLSLYMPLGSPLRAPKSDRVGRQSKKGPIRLWATPEGDFVLLLADIIRELHIKRALLEVVSLWQSKAKKIAAELQFLYIHPAHLPSSKRHPALTLKGCLCVKSFLSLQDSLKLQNMIQSTFGKQDGLLAEGKLSPKESSNDASDLCLQKRETEYNRSDNNLGDNLVTVQVQSAPEEVLEVPKVKKKQGKLKSIPRSLQQSTKVQKSFKRVDLVGSNVNPKQIRQQAIAKQGWTKEPDLSQRSICLNEFSATSNGERLRKKKFSADPPVEDRSNAGFKRLKTVMKVNSVAQGAAVEPGTGNEQLPDSMALKRNDVPKVGRLKVKGPSFQMPPCSSDGTAQNSNTCGMKKSTISSAEGVDEGSTGSVVCRVQQQLPEASAASPEVIVKRKRGRPRKNRPMQNLPGQICIDQEQKADVSPKGEGLRDALEVRPCGSQVVKSRFLEEIVPRSADPYQTAAHKFEGKMENVADFSEDGTEELWQEGIPAASKEGPRCQKRSDVVEVAISHVEDVGRKSREYSGGVHHSLRLLHARAGSGSLHVGPEKNEALESRNMCTEQNSNGLVKVPIKEHCGDRVSGGDPVYPDKMETLVSDVSDDLASSMKVNSSPHHVDADVSIRDHMDEDANEKVATPSGSSQSDKDQQEKLSTGPSSTSANEEIDPALAKSQGLATRDVKSADGPALCNEGSIPDTSIDSMLKGMPLLTEPLDFPNSDLFSGELTQLSFGSQSQWRCGSRGLPCHIDELSEAWKSGRENPSSLASTACIAGSLQSVAFPHGVSTGQTSLQTAQESQTIEAAYGHWQKGGPEVTNELLSAASHYAKVSSTSQSNPRGLPRMIQPGALNARVPLDSAGQMLPHVHQSMWPQWPNCEFVGDLRSNSRDAFESSCTDHLQGLPHRAGCWPENSYDPHSAYSSQNQMNTQAGGLCGSMVYPDRPTFASPYVQQQQTGLLSGYWGNVGGLEGHVLAARLESLAQQARVGQSWGNSNGNVQQGGMHGGARAGLAQPNIAGAVPNPISTYGAHGKPRVQQPGQADGSQMVPWPTIPTFNGNPATSSMSRLPPLPNAMMQRQPHQYRGQVQCTSPAVGDVDRMPLPQGGPATGMSQFPRGTGVQTASMHRYEETRISNQVAHQSESTWQMGNQKFIEVTHRVFL